jgi:DNA-binding FrmR family transcriptional regulator
MHEERQNIVNRLSRIEGQVKGIRKMIDEEQSCAEILMQIAAIKAAINKVGTLVFQTHFKHCLEKAAQDESSDDFIEEFMKLLGKYVT